MNWRAILAAAAIGAMLAALIVIADSSSRGGARGRWAADEQSAAVTPVAAVAPLDVRRARVRAAVCSVFGSRCTAALRVVSCETGGTFNPRAVGNAGERGIFQIHPVHFGWLDERRLFEPRYNAIAASRLSRNGRDWHHWTCKP